MKTAHEETERKINNLSQG